MSDMSNKNNANNPTWDEQTIRRRNERRQRERKQRTVFISLIITVLILLAAAVVIFLVRTERLNLSFIKSGGFGGTNDGGTITNVSADGGTDETAAGAELYDSAKASGSEAASDSVTPSDSETASGSADLSGSEAAAVSAAADTTAAGSGQNEAGTDADKALLEEAALLAAGYDYDGAIALLMSDDSHDSKPAISSAISEYTDLKASCTPVDVYSVPHIFYHSLLNDTGRAFNYEVLGTSAVDGMNAWMTTIGEFDEITQRLYDAGYVYVRLRDLVVETKNEDGTPHFSANTNLMLPEGKKAIVLSVDDLSYYHSYESAGFPDKLVLDENGLVKCHYTDASGNESLGDYDVVPRLNSFLREHPDGAYKGARGLIALTGYNGVFGYRTDTDYVRQENLMEDQRQWLDKHPEYSFDDDVAQATIIANALKDEGWEFASHTWGHLSVTGKSLEALQADNEKWVNTVQPIVGPVDTIIFAHGNDIGDWQGYSADNPQYNYYNSVGYHFYCNVDGSVSSWVQITEKYVRQGRIDADGYRLYEAQLGNDHSLSELIDLTGVFDSSRPTPVNANGQG